MGGPRSRNLCFTHYNEYVIRPEFGTRGAFKVILRAPKSKIMKRCIKTLAKPRRALSAYGQEPFISAVLSFSALEKLSMVGLQGKRKAPRSHSKLYCLPDRIEEARG